MDTITHAMFGALASQCIKGKTPTGKKDSIDYVPLAVTTFAAAFPDCDYLLFPINPLVFLDEWHRSFTHSLVLLPVWTILLTAIIVLLFPGLRKQTVRISGYVALGLVTHILLDLLTVYGTKVFYPLSSRTYSTGTTFVIDPYLSMIVLVGLVTSLLYKPRNTAMICISVVCLYVMFQWHLKLQARDAGLARIDQRDTVTSRTVALPQPFSPFHWRVINKKNNHYSTTLIDLSGFSEKLLRWEATVPFIELISAYRPVDRAEWETFSKFGNQPDELRLSQIVWQHNDFANFRNFAQFPILYRIDHDDRETCVWFSDLRYHISIMLPSFRYGMCHSRENPDWTLYRLKYFSNERDN
jgi:inner membrane protein